MYIELNILINCTKIKFTERKKKKKISNNNKN